MKNKIIAKFVIYFIFIVFTLNIVNAWTPTSNIDGKGFYTILNFTNISATEIYQDGQLVLNNESELNVNYSVSANSSTYWDGLTSQDNITSVGTISSGTWQGTQIADAYLAALNANKLTNIAYLNYKILLYWTNITDRPTALSEFTDDLGARGYTLLSNFTDDLGDRGYTYLSNFTDDLDYSDKNVNSSTYWDGETNQSDLNVNSSTWWASLTGWSSTMFEKVTNELSIKMSWFNSSVDERINTEQSRLNVNSSEFWANITSTEEIIRVGTLVNGTWNADLIEDAYINSLNAEKLSNLSHLNDKILLDADNITDPFWIAISNETNLNVNSSTWWSGIDEISDLNNAITLSKDNITDENWIEDSQEQDLNVNSSTYWDGITSQSEITHTGNLTSLNVTGNVTASWFNGQILWDYIADKFISAVGKYFYMDGSTLQMNTTELNTTIDERTAIASNLSSDGGIKIVGTALSVEAGNGLEQETNGLKVADAGINDTLMQYKLGQNLTSSDSPEFTNLALTGTLNPSLNTTFGKGWIIPQESYGCFDASCNHYMFENSSGVLIIV